MTIYRDEVVTDGVVVWSTTYDTDAKTVTVEENGVVTETRPWGDAEYERYGRAVDTNFGNNDVMIQALVAEYAKTQDPAAAQPWALPVDTATAYLPGALVTHNGSTWRNDVTVLNVWEPGTTGSGWVDTTSGS